jgi:hypothetical protein
MHAGQVCALSPLRGRVHRRDGRGTLGVVPIPRRTVVITRIGAWLRARFPSCTPSMAACAGFPITEMIPCAPELSRGGSARSY